VVSVSNAEAEPGRDLFRRRKHKYIGISVSVRDDLLEEIDRFGGEELPFSSRSAAVTTLVALGLKAWKREHASRGRE
jgi:metal-responsive CopG/Arc/MetJ family transcriptional regulator